MAGGFAGLYPTGGAALGALGMAAGAARPRRKGLLPGDPGADLTPPGQAGAPGGGGFAGLSANNGTGIMPPAPAQTAPAPTAPATGHELAPDQAGNPYPVMQPGAGGQFPGVDKHGHPMKMGAINRQIARQQMALFQQSIGPLLASQNSLIQRANTDHFSPLERDAYLAPRQQALDDSYTQAGSQLDRNLGRRGLDSSSDAVSEWANLEGRHANAQAGITNGLFDSEQARQRQDQAALIDFLMSLSGRSSQQASSNSQYQQSHDLQQQQLDQQNQFNWGSLGGLLGQGAGMGLNYLFPGAGSMMAGRNALGAGAAGGLY